MESSKKVFGYIDESGTFIELPDVVVKHSGNVHLFPDPGEDHTVVDKHGKRVVMPSMAVPDQALSLKEILNRAGDGRDLLSRPVGDYDEEEDYELEFVNPDISKLTLGERQDLLEETKFYVAKLRTQLEKDALEAREAEKKKADKAQYEAYLRHRKQMEDEENEMKFFQKKPKE